MIGIVRITIGEALRRRVLWVLFGAAVLLSAITPIGIARLATFAADAGANRPAVEALVAGGLIYIAFQTSFVLALTAALLGAPSISAEVSSGAAAVLLARPLLRSTYLIGRWLGLALIIVVEAALVGSLSIGVSALATGYAPPIPVLPVIFLAGQALVTLSLTVMLSARFPTSIAGAMAMVAYGVAWLAGVLGSLGAGGASSGASFLSQLTEIVLPTDALWRGVLFGLESPALMASTGTAGNPFFVSAPPNPFIVAWSALWMLLTLWQGIAFLRRREL